MKKPVYIQLDGVVYSVPTIVMNNLLILQKLKDKVIPSNIERTIADYNHLIESVKINYRPLEIEAEFNTVVIQKELIGQ